MKAQQDILMTYTQPELADTAFRLGIDPPDGGGKRAWAELIARRVAEDPAAVPFFLGKYAVEALNEQRRASSFEKRGPWRCAIWMANDDADLADALEELRALGLAWRSRSGWEIDPRLRGWLTLNKATRDALDSEQGLLDVMTSLMVIYGLMPAEKLAALFETLDQQPAGAPQEETELPLLSVWMRRQGMRGLLSVPEDSDDPEKPRVYLMDPEVTHPAALLLLQKQLIAAGGDYRLWRSEELVQIQDSYVMITADAGTQLDALCRELRPDLDALLDALEEAVYWLHEGDRAEALMALEEGFVSEDDEPISLTTSQRWILSRILDKVPLPQLMGRTIDEVNRFTVQEGLRIKPTDPCPCGSGRRYGKCHGRLN